MDSSEITWSATKSVDGNDTVAEHVGLDAVAPLIAAMVTRHGGPRMTASAVPPEDGGPVEEFSLDCHDTGARLVVCGPREVIDAALDAVPPGTPVLDLLDLPVSEGALMPG